MQSVLRTKLHQASLISEADAADLRAIILERAVDVAGLGFVAVGDLAFHPNIGEVSGEEIADARGQLRDGPDAPLGNKVKLELRGHRSTDRSLTIRPLFQRKPRICSQMPYRIAESCRRNCSMSTRCLATFRAPTKTTGMS